MYDYLIHIVFDFNLISAVLTYQVVFVLLYSTIYYVSQRKKEIKYRDVV